MPLSDDPWLPYDATGAVPGRRPATPVNVFRYDGAATLTPLPHVRCLSAERREGTDPGRASFRYDLASGVPGAPTTFQEAMSTASSGPLIVEPGDRIVVRATRPDGTPICLFDGVALSFGLDVGPENEGAHFVAAGIAVRACDAPVAPAFVRSCANPTITTANTQTDRPVHFNPGGLGNATASGSDVNQGTDSAHPALISPLPARSPAISRPWTLPMAVRYLLYRNNPDQTYITNPVASVVEALLVAKVPNGTGFNPADGTTYTTSDLVVPDLPATGKDWPGTVYQMVRDRGFGMKWALGTTPGGLPKTTLGLFAQQDGPIKALFLGARGTPFDPTRFNFNSGGLDRDVAEVANAWTVRGAPIRYEASFVLAAGFPSLPADGATASSIRAFDDTGPTYSTTGHDSYRLYVLDEAADGHYGAGSTGAILTAPSLSALFGSGVFAGGRLRPIGQLFSKDPNGKVLSARLSISTNYAGSKPGLWDGTGTWQRVEPSSYTLLDDRVAIRVDARNPNAWKVSRSKEANAPFPAGVAKGVESQCGMAGAVPFSLRLTCVVESDKCCGYAAGRRDESPLPYPVARLIDAADRIRKQVVHKTSEFNASDPTFGSRVDVVDRDDTALAKAEATAVQLATQSGVLSGAIEIPRITAYYDLGDRIGSIEGRGLGLRTDGDPSGANLIYPVVVGVRWQFEPAQQTTITLSDAGTDRSRYRRRVRRPHAHGL